MFIGNLASAGWGRYATASTDHVQTLTAAALTTRTTDAMRIAGTCTLRATVQQTGGVAGTGSFQLLVFARAADGASLIPLPVEPVPATAVASVTYPAVSGWAAAVSVFGPVAGPDNTYRVHLSACA